MNAGEEAALRPIRFAASSRRRAAQFELRRHRGGAQPHLNCGTIALMTSNMPWSIQILEKNGMVGEKRTHTAIDWSQAGAPIAMRLVAPGMAL